MLVPFSKIFQRRYRVAELTLRDRLGAGNFGQACHRYRMFWYLQSKPPIMCSCTALVQSWGETTAVSLCCEEQPNRVCSSSKADYGRQPATRKFAAVGILARYPCMAQEPSEVGQGAKLTVAGA